MKPKFFLAVVCTFFLTASISFGYTATFTPRLSVGAEYTDNVFLTGNEDFEEEDFITTITPGFEAELLGKTYGANVSYDAAYAMYDEYDIYDGWRHRANLTSWFEPGKHSRLGLRDSFIYTEDPIRDENLAEVRTEDPNLPVDSTIRRTRQVYYQNFAMVDFNHQFGKYDSSFTVGYKHWFREEDDSDLEDKESHSPFAGVTYWFMPKWGFSLDGSYTRGEFDFSDDVDIYTGSVSLLKRFSRRFTGFLRYTHNVVDYTGETEGDTTYNPSVGIQYDIEKDISLIAEFGYFNNDFEGRDSESNVTGNVRLIKLFKRGKLNLAVLGGYDYAFFTTDKLGFNTYYEPSASLTYRLTPRVNSKFYGSYRNTDYSDFDREDDIVTAGLGLTWRVLDWMSLGLNYRYRTVDSTIDSEEYDENRVSAGITLVPSVPYHHTRYK